jgi:predicted O-methyltransferase YrrM
MTIPTYVIRGGLEGRERLRLISRVMWPTTEQLFARVGVPGTARCLDLGCGGGDVAMALARMVGSGSVVGTDLDEAKLEIARGEAGAAGLHNVEFRRADVMEPAGDDGYDLVYVRFVLTHLTDPAGAVANAVSRLAPGGALVVEDIDFTAHFCHPDSPAFWRYVDWYSRAVEARGADPNIGPRLPGLLAGAGLVDVGVNVVQPAATSGEMKLIGPVTLEAIADAVLAAALATPQELEQTVDELYAFAQEDGTLLSLPRIVQAWGWRSPTST